jgi:hypothetical protein
MEKVNYNDITTEELLHRISMEHKNLGQDIDELRRRVSVKESQEENQDKEKTEKIPASEISRKRAEAAKKLGGLDLLEFTHITTGGNYIYLHSGVQFRSNGKPMIQSVYISLDSAMVLLEELGYVRISKGVAVNTGRGKFNEERTLFFIDKQEHPLEVSSNYVQ